MIGNCACAEERTQSHIRVELKQQISGKKATVHRVDVDKDGALR